MKQTRISIIAALFVSSLVLFAYGNSILFFSNSNSNTSNNLSVSKDLQLNPGDFKNSINIELSKSQLNSQLQTALPSNSCVAAYNQDSSSLFASVNDDQELIPASSLKLLTSLIVLSEFKPDETLETKLYGQVSNSNIKNAYLTASGDPSFVSANPPDLNRPDYFNPQNTHGFSELADQAQKKNIKNINVLNIDSAWFDLPAADADWAYEKSQVGALGALLIDEGFESTGVSNDPEQYAATKLKESFAAKNITIENIKFAPAQSVGDDLLIANSKSANIEKLISDMLKTSNNIYAEQLLAAAAHKTLNKVDKPALLNYANQKIKELLKNNSGIEITNASGYSRNAKLSCTQELEILDKAMSFGVDLTALSSKANSDGTLSIRFSNYKDKLSAKTGTLDGVTALTGKLNDSTFSFISNGEFSDNQGHLYQEKVIDLLNSFPAITDIEFDE